MKSTRLNQFQSFAVNANAALNSLIVLVVLIGIIVAIGGMWIAAAAAVGIIYCRGRRKGIPLALFSTQQAQLEVYFEKILLFNYTMKCESNTYTSISDSV